MTFLSRLRDFIAVANVRKPIPPAGKSALKPLPQVSAKPVPVTRAPERVSVSDIAPPVMSEKAQPLSKPQQLPPVTHRKTGKAGIDLMHHFEGLAKVRPDGMVEAYLCPAEVWTIGWGATGKDPFNGGMIRKGTVWTRAQCDQRFEQHLAQFEAAVREGIGKAATSQAQFDAMVSLTYNVGAAGFRRSTVLRRHIAGDFDGAAKAFLMWSKAGGKTLRGLVRRREAEAALYRSGSK